MAVGAEYLHLDNFKAFRTFHLPLRPGPNVLVGPNNAGKSTLLAAMRSAAAMIRLARRTRPTISRDDRGVMARAYAFTSKEITLEDENLRYDFRPADVRLELGFDSGVALRAVWPADAEETPFFYFLRRRAGGWHPIAVDKDCPLIGVVPVLTPLEHNEQVLSEDYVTKNRTGRLASRHFRNQLLILERTEAHSRDRYATALDEFFDFAKPWLRDITLEAPTTRLVEKGVEVDVYYREGGAAREIVWAGDGLQVYVQALLQLYYNVYVDVLVLDEPDVYLHADLQRKLFQLLSGLGPQTIIASHSTELIAEAPPESIVWVDRTRTAAVRAPLGQKLADLSLSIGSLFNLRLARVLRSRVAIFVEGQDMALIRILAERVGATNIAAETAVAVVPLHGAGNWRRLEGFKWLADEMLKGAVQGYVLLDRDYHSDHSVGEITVALSAAGLKCHVWFRHELENYLLSPGAIARVGGVSESDAIKLLVDATDALKDDVLEGMLEMRFAERKEKKVTVGPISRECRKELNAAWTDLDGRARLCPGKEVMAGVSRELQRRSGVSLSARQLASNLSAQEVPPEMADLLASIDRAAAGP